MTRGRAVVQRLREWLGVGFLPPPSLAHEQEREEMKEALRTQEAKEWGVILRFQEQSRELRRSLAEIKRENRR